MNSITRLSYTEESYPILRRYHVGDHPLLKEQRAKMLEPTTKFKEAVKRVFLQHNAVEGAADGLDRRTVRKQQTKEMLKSLNKRIDVNYAREFMKWLQGRSVFNRRTEWGTDNLFHIPGVVDYLKEATAMRHDFLHKLNLLAKFGPRTLQECELYFKYIVLHYGIASRKGPRGEHQYMLVDGMLDFLDDFSELAVRGGLGAGSQPYSGPYRPTGDPDSPLLKELRKNDALMPIAQAPRGGGGGGGRGGRGGGGGGGNMDDDDGDDPAEGGQGPIPMDVVVAPQIAEEVVRRLARLQEEGRFPAAAPPAELVETMRASMAQAEALRAEVAELRAQREQPVAMDVVPEGDGRMAQIVAAINDVTAAAADLRLMRAELADREAGEAQRVGGLVQGLEQRIANIEQTRALQQRGEQAETAIVSRARALEMRGMQEQLTSLAKTEMAKHLNELATAMRTRAAQSFESFDASLTNAIRTSQQRLLESGNALETTRGRFEGTITTMNEAIQRQLTGPATAESQRAITLLGEQRDQMAEGFRRQMEAMQREWSNNARLLTDRADAAGQQVQAVIGWVQSAATAYKALEGRFEAESQHMRLLQQENRALLLEQGERMGQQLLQGAPQQQLLEGPPQRLLLTQGAQILNELTSMSQMLNAANAANVERDQRLLQLEAAGTDRYAVMQTFLDRVEALQGRLLTHEETSKAVSSTMEARLLEWQRAAETGMQLALQNANTQLQVSTETIGGQQSYLESFERRVMPLITQGERVANDSLALVATQMGQLATIQSEQQALAAQLNGVATALALRPSEAAMQLDTIQSIIPAQGPNIADQLIHELQSALRGVQHGENVTLTSLAVTDEPVHMRYFTALPEQTDPTSDADQMEALLDQYLSMHGTEQGVASLDIVNNFLMEHQIPGTERMKMTLNERFQTNEDIQRLYDFVASYYPLFKRYWDAQAAGISLPNYGAYYPHADEQGQLTGLWIKNPFSLPVITDLLRETETWDIRGMDASSIRDLQQTLVGFAKVQFASWREGHRVRMTRQQRTQQQSQLSLQY